MAMSSLQDLFVHHLKDMYYAEKKIAKSLPKMADKANELQLRQAFQDHLSQTEQHIERLESVFEEMGEKASAVKCEGIDGIIKEGEDLIGKSKDADALDAGLIASAQAVEHYEIARYGTLAAWANELGMDDVQSVLHQILDEEKATDEKLTKIAEQRINRAAA